MTEEQWKEVDNYLFENLLPADSALTQALDDSRLAGLPAISVSPTQGQFLQMLAQLAGARSILEIGTLGGYSTIWLARGLRTGGRVVTLELNAKHAEIARRNIARAGFHDVVDVHEGNALEILPQFVTEKRGPFDLIFIDADKPSIPAFFEWSLKLSRAGTLIVVDNVIRDGAVIDPESDDPRKAGVRRFFEMLGDEPGVTATAIQMVGTKGYGGFAFAIVEQGRMPAIESRD